MRDILVPISAGELLDKISILRIKARRIAEPDKLLNVRRELALLEATWQRSYGASAATTTATTTAATTTGAADSAADVAAPAPPLAAELAALEAVNAALWDIEDRIRAHEAQRRFDAEFIELARAVYLRNDERAAIKRRLNVLLGSPIIEEKSYQPYPSPRP
ncbi:MAG TPA: hypothetical protein VMD56_04395 [Steroidobacteraceae bacterium]|nr:hypothetical protein [Steroidobacteraceae bacterium]